MAKLYLVEFMRVHSHYAVRDAFFAKLTAAQGERVRCASHGMKCAHAKIWRASRCVCLHRLTHNFFRAPLSRADLLPPGAPQAPAQEAERRRRGPRGQPVLGICSTDTKRIMTSLRTQELKRQRVAVDALNEKDKMELQLSLL